MKRSDLHHISDARNHRQHRQNRLIAVLCIFICVICVITIFMLIKDIVAKNLQNSTAATETSDTIESSVLPSVDPTNSSSTPTVTVSPAPTTTVPGADREAGLAALKASIVTYLESKNGRYSVYYVNAGNGEAFGYNEAEPMVAASSIKIAYNTYLYQQAANGIFTMDEVMKYNAAPYPEGDLETGTGIIQTAANGTEYTLSELSKLSITISDNCATNMVLRYLGGIDAVNDGYMVPVSAIVNYRSSVSYTDYLGAEQSGRHRTSAQDLALYAKNLYDLYQASPEAYAPLMNNLQTTEYAWGIPAGVAPGVVVAHKVGFNPSYGANNDIGIVYADETYVLCVMTESGSDSEAQEIIKEVSRMVYEYIGSLYAA